MRASQTAVAIALPVLFALVASHVQAQQMTIGTPFNSASDSFFERIGTNFNFQWNGGAPRLNGADNPMTPYFFFRQGSFNSAIPQFGGYDPSADARLGFNVRHGPWSADFNFALGQGSRRSLVSQVPSVTIMNGQQGYVSDTSQSPFVISLIPVVGGYPAVASLNPVPQLPTYRYNPELIREINSRMQRARQGYHQQDGGQVQPMEREAFRRLPIPEDHEVAQAVPDPSPRQAPMVVRGASGNEAPLVLAGGENPTPLTAETPEARLDAARDSSAARPVPSVAEARRRFEADQAARGGR